MPAQWPTFINNVSKKLSSGDASSVDEFAIFLANEYFNCVKTAQTIYGNTHQSGQKSILENGFKDAFKKIYEEETVMFDSKSSMSTYADLFEKPPGPDTSFDLYCELEKWTDENKDNLEKFLFYPFFTSTCPDPNIETQSEIGQIDATLLEEANKPGEPQRFITMSISGFSTGIDYRFLYSINGEDQPIQIAINNVLNVPAPTVDGVYVFTFKAVYNNDVLLKEINKSITLDINQQQFETIEVVKDPFVDKKPREGIPQMTEDERVKNIALRVAYQNDGSREYREWVDRLDIGHNKQFGKKVKAEVLKISSVPSNPINPYIFQEEHIDDKQRIPEWINAADICKFVYIKEIDQKIVGYPSKILLKVHESIELRRNNEKIKEYIKEKDKWYDLLRTWGNSITVDVEEETQNVDGYEVMAQAIIDYWKSTTIQPFKPGPPILPCTSIPPLGGKYTPISYGDKIALADDLRRAWNTGKRFKQISLTPIASKLVASAVAVACTKHLLGVKFLYLGGLIIPIGPPVPMVGFSPTTF